MNYLNRGLIYIPLKLVIAKLFIFVDGSFANNRDLSSQIGYKVIIANKTTGQDEFNIRGNLIY
jgi:hypothetical protein